MYNVADYTMDDFADPLSGDPWKIVWVRGGPKMSARDRKHIGRLILLMSYRDQQQEDFKGDSCEGRVVTVGKTGGFGQFYGTIYNLHLETETGNIDGEVLMCEKRGRSKQRAALN